MNLRWKEFEKRMGARVKPYDAAQRMRFWQKVDHFINTSPDIPVWFARSILEMVFVGFVLFSREPILSHPEVAMAAVGLWWMLIALPFSIQTRNSEQIWPEQRMLWMLPLSRDQIFNQFRGQTVRGSIWLLGECLLVFGILAAGSPNRFAGWIGAVLCASMQAALMNGFVFHIRALKMKTEWLAFTVLFLALALCICCASPAIEIRAAEALYCINPFGWINGLYLEGFLRGNPHAFWFIVPWAAVLACVPFSLRRVRQTHDMSRLRRVEDIYPIVLSGEEKSPDKPEDRNNQKQRILNGDFLRPLAWESSGVVEQLISRGLSAREKRIVEMHLIAKPLWSRRFLELLVLLVLWLVVFNQIGFSSLTDIFTGPSVNRSNVFIKLFWFFGCFLLCSAVLMKSLLLFIGFGSPEWSLMTQPNKVQGYRTHRLFPISFWDTLKIRIKINTVLFFLLLPIALLFSNVFTSLVSFLELEQGRSVMEKYLFLLWGGSIYVASLKLTLPMLDRISFKQLKMLFVICVVSFGFLAAGFGLLSSPSPAQDCLFGGAFALGVAGWLIFSRAYYLRGPKVANSSPPQRGDRV